MGVIGKKSILKNYLLAYVGVAVAACAVLGLVLLNVSSRYMDQQERDAIQQRLISASDDFCYQMEQMEQLSIRLRTKERYQPFYLAKNAYNELEMIKDFAQYSGLVPIAGAYYLAYEDTAVVSALTRRSNTPCSPGSTPIIPPMKILSPPCTTARASGALKRRISPSFSISAPFILTAIPRIARPICCLP